MNLLSKFELPISYNLGMKVLWRYFHKGIISELIYDLGDCRTALATTGLLITGDGDWNWDYKGCDLYEYDDDMPILIH